MEKSLQAASELEAIAQRKGVQIIEPFAGVQLKTTAGVFRILGPSQEYYEELLTEEQAPAATVTASSYIQDLLRKAAAGVVKLLEESLHIETLRDDGETTPTNDSSVISLLTVDDRQLLLTGDAGIPALEQAMAVVEAEGFQPGGFRFVQVPHHGSRRNVGPSILDRMLGPKGQTTQHSRAYVSVPKKNPEHKFPAKKVTNAFHRRGYSVSVTQGQSIRHKHDAPAREGWTALTPLPFYEKVEEDSGT